MSAPLRILVAEDDPDDVLLLQAAFQKARLNASVHFVEDGQDLINWLQGHPPFDDPIAHPLPTLLLLDLDLPRVSGLEALTWIRQQPRLRELAVIALTGSERTEDLESAYGLGVLDYLRKPCGAADMARLLRDLQRLWEKITSGRTS